MEDAGHELAEVSVHFSEATGDLILGVETDDPVPSKQTPEMLARSEGCILQVNGGVRATTVPTTIPEGLEGEFTQCVRDAGYEVFDVEIAEDEVVGIVVSGFSNTDPVPEHVVAKCEEELRR